MKRVVLILAGLILFVHAQSQISLGDNGLYYDKDQNPFTGLYREYYDNGQVKQDMILVNGKIDGQATLWYRSGTIKEIRMFKAGLRDGLWISFNEMEKKTGEASYKDDQKEGHWRIWDDNGVLRYEMYYRKGQKAGLWIMYDESGNKTSEKRYSDDK